MADKRIMTPEEKALLQAKHRQEEAEARNRQKERDARTHRLVQEGAILERCIPVRINNRNIRQDNATANLKQAKKILLNNHAPNQN